MEKTDTSKIRLFYVPATADKPPTAIDFIRETEDGQLVSEIRGSTQAELSQEHGQEVKIIDLAHRMITLQGLTVRDDKNPYGDIAIKTIQ